MAKQKVRPRTGAEAQKQRILQISLSWAGLFVLAGLVLIFVTIRNRDVGLKKQLLSDWENGSYTEAFEKSSKALEEKPLDTFLLTIHGYVSYQLAVSQINTGDTFFYLDKCIWSLRKALFRKAAGGNGRIQYILGKAYYEKGANYADLSVRYLEESRTSAYDAGDIPEYLGLAYEALHEYRKSVEAFSLALDPLKTGAASDRLLLAIARSYTGLEDWENAGAYLSRCIEQTKDAEAAIKARLMLGRVLRNSGDTAGAEAAFNAVLEMMESAEASFELGEIYAARGDTIRARAAWRRANRADNNYRPARIRLDM